jgi:3-dehydroquinate synthase
MSVITIKADRISEVHISDGEWDLALESVLEGRARAAFIVSETIASQINFEIESDTDIHIFTIPDGEEGKSSPTLLKLWDWLGAAGFTRSDIIIGIGGGATTDIAGFAAATWLRGIDWVAVPTSVAGMVDAAIGGKTGMNSDYGKNLIGSFHSPIRVIVDTSWLTTLSDRDFSAGLAEVIKCGFISDKKILELVKDKSLHDIRGDIDLVTQLITLAIRVKAGVVSEDFKESFHREILNYGHTLAHAIEIDSKYSLRHGEAVAIGMVFAAELSHSHGSLSSDIVDQHRRILSALDLPISYDASAWVRLLPLLSLDKKARGHTIRFVLLETLEKTTRFESPGERELAAIYERVSK